MREERRERVRGQGRAGKDAAHVQIPRILPRIPTFTMYNARQTFNIPDHVARLTRCSEEAEYGAAKSRRDPGIGVGGGGGGDKDPRKV